MKIQTLLSLICLLSLAPSMFGQASTPTISEEARKHFVAGMTFSQNAKTAADFSQAVSEFRQAVELAPQLPQARYNLAKAEEAEGNYSGAIADLKLYQQFKLSDSEARNVQDKIYALGTKQQMKGDAANAQAAAKGQARRDFLRKIEGDWYDTGWHLNISRSNDSVSIRMDARGDSRQSFPNPGYNVLISGNSLKFSIRNPHSNGTEKIWNFDWKLLEDGHIRLKDKASGVGFWRMVGGQIDW